MWNLFPLFFLFLQMRKMLNMYLLKSMKQAHQIYVLNLLVFTKYANEMIIMWYPFKFIF